MSIAISIQSPTKSYTAANESLTGLDAKESIQHLFIQPKLTIGSADDPFEEEADEMADKVMRMSMPEPINFFSTNNNINRKCAHCEEEEKQLQKKERNNNSISVAPPIVHEALSFSGKPLDDNTRSFMESRFSYDFSNVKIHDSDIAAKSADSINAFAYTSGNNVVFNSAQYNTNSDSGKRLLAHELTHVVQQGNDKPFIQRQGGEVRHIGVYRGVPGFLDCELEDVKSDYTTSCCLQETLDQLPALYKTSREFTDRTIARLDDGANMDKAITNHFGEGAIPYREDILNNLRTIRKELDQQSSHRPVCRIGLISNEGMDIYSKVDPALFCDFGVIASATREGKILTLCVDLDGNPSGGWSVILHEVAHFSKVALLPGRDATSAQKKAGEYETYYPQKSEGKYPNPMPYALKNADSYAMFVKETGDPSWASEPNPGRAAPNFELGGIMTLEGEPRFGVAGRMLWTPLGRSAQLTFGLGGLWFPGGESSTTGGDLAPSSLRAYTGGELGFRWIVGGRKVQFVLDVAGGAGGFVRVDKAVDPAVAARIGLGVRVGGPDLGIGISVEAMKIFNISEDDLQQDAAKNLIGGLMIQGHWGGTSAKPR